MEQVSLPTNVSVGHEICDDLHLAESREVLITNGKGGYCFTLANSLTRSYHGLLIATLRPPLDRTLLLSKLNETVTYLDRADPLYTDRRKVRECKTNAAAQQSLERESATLDRGPATRRSTGGHLDPSRSICSSQSSASQGTVDPCHQEVVSPEGFKLLRGVHLEGTVPVFRYSFPDAILEKKIWMKRGQNTVYVTYYLRCASHAVRLQIMVLVNCRDHHSRTCATEPQFIHSANVGGDDSSLAIHFTKDHRLTTLTLSASNGRAELVNEWIAASCLR